MESVEAIFKETENHMKKSIELAESELAAPAEAKPESPP